MAPVAVEWSEPEASTRPGEIGELLRREGLYSPTAATRALSDTLWALNGPAVRPRWV